MAVSGQIVGVQWCLSGLYGAKDHTVVFFLILKTYSRNVYTWLPQNSYTDSWLRERGLLTPQCHYLVMTEQGPNALEPIYSKFHLLSHTRQPQAPVLCCLLPGTWHHGGDWQRRSGSPPHCCFPPQLGSSSPQGHG